MRKAPSFLAFPVGARTRPVALAAGAALLTAGLAAAAGAGAEHLVSQKGRRFDPGSLSIARGEALTFVNDDGDLLHHVYLDDPAFSFDTGDQEPGSRSVIVFPKAGQFTVMCGIHPRMKLAVQVK
ncbi:hypothetical protein MMB17_02495 [Methylobacterium organophilum]|uniref:hypothetical protein n=1 Tax=Methylobacterium organophilum TaxID=410 RepID=UPI001F132EAE|nr:hypothetical protein [Methylobacterium organophilum]UMY18239.1 hypothetical protein MMB17_02495 [Methylobacterium organophilum]